MGFLGRNLSPAVKLESKRDPFTQFVRRAVWKVFEERQPSGGVGRDARLSKRPLAGALPATEMALHREPLTASMFQRRKIGPSCGHVPVDISARWGDALSTLDRLDRLYAAQWPVGRLRSLPDCPVPQLHPDSPPRPWPRVALVLQ